jgi:phytoene dehydrogenase-like protein
MTKIIIIGSGIGGSGVGALISKETNHDLTLYEQATILGGRCASYIKKDNQGRNWKFDVGCHIFSTGEKGPLGEILRRIDKPLKWSLTRNPGPRIIVMGMDMSKRIADISKKKGEGKGKSEADVKPSYFRDLEAMSMEETHNYDYVPLTKFLDAYFGSGKAVSQKMMYSMQAGVMHGVGAEEVSAGEYIRCAADNARSYSMGYPYGGTGAIPEAYCAAIREKGNQVFIGKEGQVHKIVVDDGVVKGVEVGKDKEFQEAEIVIANSDIKTTVFKLVGEKHFNQEYLHYIKKLTWGGMVCSLKLGLDKVMTDQKMLTYVGRIGDMKTSFMAAMLQPGIDIDPTKLPIPEKTVLFVVPISNHDPALAPPGCQNIHVVSPTSYGRMVLWDKEGDKKWEQACINTLKEFLPDIEDHIVVRDFVSTSYLNAYFGKEGAAIGVAQSIDQIGAKRPSQISPIKGLYNCSFDVGRTAWGIGTEAAARAALDLFEVLQRNNFANDRIYGTNPI